MLKVASAALFVLLALTVPAGASPTPTPAFAYPNAIGAIDLVKMGVPKPVAERLIELHSGCG